MLKNLVMLAVAATLVGMLVSMAPDLKRYAKIHAM
jgi:hypothetical protein